jgi:tetrahedral aminopeptidase
MKNLIQRLVEAVGPSGYEKQVRELILAEVTPLADEARVDALGSLIVRKGQKTPQGLRIMLDAHMDEIGVIVTHIDENGFVRFTNLGGVNARMCQGSRVRFTNGTRGCIGVEVSDNNDKPLSLEQMFIDVGASSRADCPVTIGDSAAFDRPYMDLGNRLMAKSMDDRLGVAVLIETLRQLTQTPHEVYFVFSVQEEVGLRGATTAAYGINPDVGISVDVTLTGDTPKGLVMDVALGKGPAIKVRDSGQIADPRLVRWMADTAEKAGLPHQYEVLLAGTTDASVMQLARAGVPSGCLSLPCRYVHSPSETADYRDVQNSVRLLVELLSHPFNLEER